MKILIIITIVLYIDDNNIDKSTDANFEVHIYYYMNLLILIGFLHL